MNNNERYENNNDNKRRRFSTTTIVVGILLLIAIVVAILIYLRNVFKGEPRKDDPGDTISEITKTRYNKLLKYINDEIKLTSMGDAAYSLVSFSFNEHHFYISGFNTKSIYTYDVDLNDVSLSDEEAALTFITSNELGSTYPVELTKYEVVDNVELTNKYETKTCQGKFKVGKIGPSTKAFMTKLEGNEISFISDEDLDAVTSSSYEVKTISSSHPLFEIYKYIAIK